MGNERSKTRQEHLQDYLTMQEFLEILETRVVDQGGIWPAHSVEMTVGQEVKIQLESGETMNRTIKGIEASRVILDEGFSWKPARELTAAQVANDERARLELHNPPRRATLVHSCPTCHAKVARPCRERKGKVRHRSHLSRVNLYRYGLIQRMADRKLAGGLQAQMEGGRM